MTSNDLGNKESIIKLFDKYKLDYQENIVLGEFYRTKYLEIVATK